MFYDQSLKKQLNGLEVYRVAQLMDYEEEFDVNSYVYYERVLKSSKREVDDLTRQIREREGIQQENQQEKKRKNNLMQQRTQSLHVYNKVQKTEKTEMTDHEQQKQFRMTYQSEKNFKERRTFSQMSQNYKSQHFYREKEIATEVAQKLQHKISPTFKQMNVQTKQDFFKTYKDIDRIKEKNKVTILTQDLQLMFKWGGKHAKTPDKKPDASVKFQSFSKQGPTQNEYRLGNTYMKSLSKALPTKVVDLQLNKNRITSEGMSFTKHLNTDIQIINLNDNPIGIQGAKQFKTFLLQATQLTSLQLENNRLQDEGGLLIGEGLAHNNKLRILNLSKNLLSDKVGNALNKILQNDCLRELYLHWNQLTYQSVTPLLKIVTKASNLGVLDLSWNDLSKCAPALKNFFLQNTDLVHIDISYCNIDQKSTIEVKTGLDKNQTIYGIHYDGNYGFVDSRQFLHPTAISEQPSVMHRINSVQINRAKKLTKYNQIQKQSVCWICDGYQPMDFVWENKDTPCFLHLEFEGYEGFYLPTNSVSRMVPPQEFHYFFMVDDEVNILDSQPKSETMLEDRETFFIEGQKYNEILQQKNIKENQKVIQIVVDKYFNISTDIKPRQKQDLYKITTQKIERWNFRRSLFRDWVPVSENLVANCFELDWSQNKISKLVKKTDELFVVRNHFKTHYYHYIYLFRKFAIQQPLLEIPAIGIHSFKNFVNYFSMCDENFTNQDVELKWASTTTNFIKRDNIRNPERGIVRYQFMEALFRLAEHKYMNSGLVGDYGTAVENLHKDYFGLEFKGTNPHIWRKQVYHTEFVDLMLKKHKSFLEAVLLFFSKNKSYPHFTYEIYSVIQIMQVFVYSIKVEINQEDKEQCFIYSLMLHVDELMSNKFLQMFFVEFLECISRLAEFVIRPHNLTLPEKIGLLIKKIREISKQESWNIQEKDEKVILRQKTLSQQKAK